MKKYLALWLAAALMLSLAGCAKTDETVPPAPPEEAVVETEPPAPPEVEEEPPAPPEEAEAVYTFDKLEIPVPKEYLDLLVVDTELEAWNEHWTPLVSFSEKASIEAGQLDHPDEDWGDGWLCTVVRLDRIGFEYWASNDGTGTELFAKDGEETYYLMSRPTDVRFYRTRENAADLAQWSMLCDWAGALDEEILARNGLEAYDASDLFDVDYTYGGEHFDIGYSFPGEPRDFVILVVSQPAKQGEGGLWCVERVREVYSEYDWTDTHLIFPSALDINETAADYYAALQAECDAGEHPELLTPIGAAVDYARHDVWLFGEDVSATDFTIIESLG